MMMQKILIGMVLMMALVMAGCASQNNETKEPRVVVPWQEYFPAMATGKGESKPILLHFATTWNSGSKRMTRETYGNYDVMVYLQENFATGWVDVEEYPSLGKKYAVSALPTIWFLDSQGKKLTSVDGFLGPERILLILEFIHTKAYEEMSFELWKEQPRGP